MGNIKSKPCKLFQRLSCRRSKKVKNLNVDVEGTSDDLNYTRIKQIVKRAEPDQIVMNEITSDQEAREKKSEKEIQEKEMIEAMVDEAVKKEEKSVFLPVLAMSWWYLMQKKQSRNRQEKDEQIEEYRRFREQLEEEEREEKRKLEEKRYEEYSLNSTQSFIYSFVDLISKFENF